MEKHSFSPERNIQLLSARVDELRLALRQREPVLLAANSASHFTQLTSDTGLFHLNFWDQPVSVAFPEFGIIDDSTGQQLNVALQALILYYFHTADSAQLSAEWISFSDLEDGRFYAQAFQGYTGRELARVFQDDRAAFVRAAKILNGNAIPISDAGYEFRILPKVHLLTVFWQGDEDFPSNYQILFDASINHFLPTDACAIAGSMLTRRLIKAFQS